MHIIIGTPSGYTPKRSLHGTPKEKVKKGDYWLSTYDHAKKLIGSLRVEKYENTFVIREVIVDPEYRGKGIGRLMMTDILEMLKRNELPIVLYVEPTNNVAIKLYTSLGFKLIKKGARFGDKYQLYT